MIWSPQASYQAQNFNENLRKASIHRRRGTTIGAALADKRLFNDKVRRAGV